MTRRGILALVLLWVLALSESHANRDLRGPFQRRTGVGAHRMVMNWADNLTIGSINTVIGGGVILVAMIANGVGGRRGIHLSVTGENHGAQILVENGAVGYSEGAYSLGIFNLGGWDPSHEAGHSYQSATLGPLYLPTVGLSYLLGGYSGSFMERWADLEAEVQGDHATTFPIQIGAGFMNVQGENQPYLLLRIAIDERADRVDEEDGTRLQRIQEWVKTEILFPLARETYERNHTLPIGLEVNLLRRTVRVSTPLLDRAPVDGRSTTGPSLNLELATEQDYARAVYTPYLNLLHFSAARWAQSFGLSYVLDDRLQIALTGGGHVGADGVHAEGSSPVAPTGSTVFSLGGGFQGRLSMHVLNYLTLYGNIEQYWLLNNLSRFSVEAGATNHYRTTNNSSPDFLNYLDFTLRYRYEQWTRASDQSTVPVHGLDLLFGPRF